MPRRRIQFHAGEYYHLYNRGAFRNQVFHDREEYALFVKRWRQHVKPAQIQVIAYCLIITACSLRAQSMTVRFVT